MDERTNTLVYKRDHQGDPDEDGMFGCNDCMGEIRWWSFTAVIGIGGIGTDVDPDIVGRANWIGVGAHKRSAPANWGYRGPLVTFDHFVDCNSLGWMVRAVAPNLAARMYDINVRATMSFDLPTRREIARLLRWARQFGPSPALALAMSTQVAVSDRRRCPLMSSRPVRC
jgi:hypothetical protein